MVEIRETEYATALLTAWPGVAHTLAQITVMSCITQYAAVVDRSLALDSGKNDPSCTGDLLAWWSALPACAPSPIYRGDPAYPVSACVHPVINLFGPRRAPLLPLHSVGRVLSRPQCLV